MASLGDVAVQFPISGSYSPPDAVMRMTHQVSSASLTVLTASLSSQLALPNNPNRRSFMMVNRSPSTAFLRFGGSVVNSDQCSLVAGAALTIYPYVIMPVFTGEIHVIWDSSVAATGSMKITEFT